MLSLNCFSILRNEPAFLSCDPHIVCQFTFINDIWAFGTLLLLMDWVKLASLLTEVLAPFVLSVQPKMKRISLPSTLLSIDSAMLL